MKFYVVIATALAASVLMAAPRGKVKNAAPVPEPPDGGTVLVGAEGKLAIVDACGIGEDAIKSASKKIGNFFMIESVTQGGQWSLMSAKDSFAATGATAAVFVVKDEALPISLIAMESRWGVVNAALLDGKTLEKEVLRVAIVLLGGASSKYPASTMRPAFSVDDLNEVGELVTIDTLMAIFPNLEKYGFKQYQMMTYREACEEGLAPAPINDEQKAIADEYKNALK